MAKGLCRRCYLKAYRTDPDNNARIAATKSAWYWEHHEANLAKRKAYREEQNFDGKREAAIIRARHRCERCKRKVPLVVHHKDGSGRGQSEHNNALSNLEAICRRCHKATHPESQYRGGSRKLGRWSRAYDACTACNTTTIRHASRGLCRTCCARKRRKKMT